MMNDLCCVQEYVNNEIDTTTNYFDEKEENDVVVDVIELNIIREKIESMPKFNQIEVLRILRENNDIILNENKYGIHINMSELKTDVIEKLKKYINYVNTQELNFNEIEMQKEEFKNIYFKKDNKDNNGKNSKYAI